MRGAAGSLCPSGNSIRVLFYCSCTTAARTRFIRPAPARSSHDPHGRPSSGPYSHPPARPGGPLHLKSPSLQCLPTPPPSQLNIVRHSSSIENFKNNADVQWVWFEHENAHVSCDLAPRHTHMYFRAAVSMR